MRVTEDVFKQMIEAYVAERPGTVLIALTQLDDGSVGCVVTPNVGDQIDLAKRGAGLTAAQGYALRAIRAIQQASKEQLGRDPKVHSRLILPPGLRE